MSAVADLDQRVRLAAFDWLERQRQLHGDVLPRDVLIQGFTFEGRRVPLISPQQGIHKPAILDLPLSILTSPPSDRKRRPHDDALSPDELSAVSLSRHRQHPPRQRRTPRRDAVADTARLLPRYRASPSAAPSWTYNPGSSTCYFPQARALGRTRSSPRSAPAVWEKSIVRVIPASAARSPSRFSPPPLPVMRTTSVDSSRKRVPPRR